MKIYDIEVHGIQRALCGLARSYNSDPAKMHDRAIKLGPLDKGHNKFLRMIHIWCEVEAPRFWWSEFDTYKIGTVAQSDSTMHTLKKSALTQDHFEYPINYDHLLDLNRRIRIDEPIDCLKNQLPDGFLQGRTLNLNYAVLREITLQRHNHRLPQWQYFLKELLGNIPDIELLGIPHEILCKLNLKNYPCNEK